MKRTPAVSSSNVFAIEALRGVTSPAIIRYFDSTNQPRLAFWWDQRLFDLEGAKLDDLLTRTLRDLRTELDPDAVRRRSREIDASTVRLSAPVETQETWAAGVTYRRSREARVEEAVSKDIYTQVYQADRPELFFKSVGWRVVGPDGLVGIRSDSSWDVPEPELAVLSNRYGEIVAFACGNDMSSRSIEGDNPLYLPQAKVYDHSCALGPAAVLSWAIDATDLAIRLTIERAGQIAFEGAASTSLLVRRVDGLVAAVHSFYTLPVGAWLLTGTSIVPDSTFSLKARDIVRVSIEGLGVLANLVTVIAAKPADARPHIDET